MLGVHAHHAIQALARGNHDIVAYANLVTADAPDLSAEIRTISCMLARLRACHLLVTRAGFVTSSAQPAAVVAARGKVCSIFHISNPHPSECSARDHAEKRWGRLDVSEWLQIVRQCHGAGDDSFWMAP